MTNTILFNTTLGNIQRQHTKLQQAYEASSSGIRLHRPSDDPTGAQRVLDVRAALGSLEEFTRHRVTANSLLHTTESTLGDLENTLVAAKNLTLRALNDTLGPEQQRRIIAAEVGSLYEQALHLANTEVGGRYLFAGQAYTQRPFSASATVSSSARQSDLVTTLQPLAADDLTINGVSIRPTQSSDDPLSTTDAAASARAIAAAINAATASTGVEASAANTTRSLTVQSFGDLSGNAFTINGVAISGTITDAASLVAAVNAAQVPGVLATSSGSSNLTLSAPDGRNIALSTDGSASTGLRLLEFDPGGGAALSETTTGVVTLQAEHAFTLDGLEPGKAGFQAGAVNLTARFHGDNQVINQAIGSGQTLPVNVVASQLLLPDLQPTLDRNTPLATLRQGQGIQPGSIAVTDRAGQTATIDLSSAVTVGDVLDAISNAAGINVTATVHTSQASLTIADDNGSPLGNLTITDVAGGTTARDLGIAADRPGQVAGTPLAPQLTTATPLSLLYRGRGVSLGTLHVTNGSREADVDLSTARTVGDVVTAIQNSNTGVQVSVSTQGNALSVRSTNTETVAVVTEVSGGQSAAALGLQGGRDVFTSLGLLQEALQKNDTHALRALATALDADRQNAADLQADLGVRSNTVSKAEDTQTDFALHLRTLLSDTEDSDIVEVFTRITRLNVGLQAALATAARIVQPTLFDFLR
ncbi:MAG: flagellin hook IN motif-containing protein [Candidatus Tectimicrobiota bacterium]